MVSQETVGAVLVVGGGVGGVQAALDLAQAGYYVYLVDNETAIGGVMAQLDKTFPTNDCSMCILSPKLVDVDRHHNIKILTNVDIQALAGTPGNFTVTLRQRARYIDADKCTGCGTCATVCPIERPNAFDMGLGQRKAIYRHYPQAVPSTFVIEKQGTAKCRDACPADVNAQAYVRLVAAGKFAEALQVVKERNPLPGICGRVCTHPCEQACHRGQLDEPIAIMAIKRFLTDWELAQGDPIFPPVTADKREEKVAIIGAGPAGLTAAYNLARLGYSPTIFEALDRPGGMLTTGIPAYRLPREIIDKEVEAILRMGVELKLSTPIGPDRSLKDLMTQQGFQAVFIATGAYAGMKLGIEGEDQYQGVQDCVTFLKGVNIEGRREVGRQVLVVGGGNAAIDSARTALRLGAQEVTIVYRRSRQEMPANAWEVEEAQREGIQIHYLATPIKILGQDGRVTGMECVRMELGEPDESGRRRPIPIPDSNFTINADMIIPAISQRPDLSFLPAEHGFEISRWNSLVVDELTKATSIPGVFAGGDVVTGPRTAIEAIAAGREAAISIDRYLRGVDLRAGREKPTPELAEPALENVPRAARVAVPSLPLDERRGNFKEVEQVISQEAAMAEAQRCLSCSICCECLQCEEACEAHAIDHGMPAEQELKLNVGALILSPGFAPFDARLKSELGYGRYPNVVTSMEFERILCASGPFQGHIVRPADQQHPRKIAFIQCVGSRDRSCDRDFCSSVCCMYASKEAVIAREHASDVDSTIFYMDMRSFGKDFDRYIERAQSEYGVRYVRARVCAVKQLPNHDLVLTYEAEDGSIKSEQFELVVLSIGLDRIAGAQELAKVLGIELNRYGFATTRTFSPVATSRPGIYVCGAFQAPKDIPETVTQASGAAANIAALLSAARGTLVHKKTYPPPVPVHPDDEPRIGVFVCHCGINIGGYVDVPAVLEAVKDLPNVTYVEQNLYTCSQDTQALIKEAIREHRLNRVVVASCTPRTHEPLFQETCEEAGLNRYLFEMANIRDQCSWVHQQTKEAATAKAIDLLKMTIAKSRKLRPLERLQIEVKQVGIVLGGGAAGLTAALQLARQGISVHLIEQTDQLGGLARRLTGLLNEAGPAEQLAQLISAVQEHPAITVHCQTRILDINGYIGNFKVTVQNSQRQEIEGGAIIVATGGSEYQPQEHFYGQDPRVLTQLDLEARLGEGPLGVRTVVMIQCIGSRNSEHPYCSRVCCTTAIKNALRIKQAEPQTRVIILYRDMRTYGLREEAYHQAREQGVLFFRFDPEAPYEVTKNGESLQVTVKDLLLQRRIRIQPDLLVLSAGIVPNPDNLQLSKLLKVPLNQDRFFLEAHMKLRPVEFATDGVYLAGLAHGPKSLDETIAQAAAATSRALSVLAQKYVTAEGMVAHVDDQLCIKCGLCEQNCPYGAIARQPDNDRRAAVTAVLCKGCGICASNCPVKAISVGHFTREQFLAQISALD